MSDDNVHDFDADRQRALRVIRDLLKDKPGEFQNWIAVVIDEIVEVVGSIDPEGALKKEMVTWNRLMVEKERPEFERFIRDCIAQYEKVSHERDAEGGAEGKLIPGDFGKGGKR